MRTALLPLQKAIYDRLKTIYPVYDEVPQGAQFPYITFGADMMHDWSTKLKRGQTIQMDLHLWSQYRGIKEIGQMIDDIVLALDTPLILLNFSVGITNIKLISLLRDPDGITRHGVLEIEANILEV